MPQEDESAKRSRDIDGLRAAMQREGCPVCLVLLEDMQQVMDSWQYEGFTEVDHRHELIRIRGFCPLHTWQLAQLGSGFQLAVIYSETLPEVLAALQRDAAQQQGAPGSSSFGGLWSRFSHHPAPTYAQPAFDSCPFCKSRANIEARLISTFVEQLQAEEMRALFSQSIGLCLSHFTQARAEAERNQSARLSSLLEGQQACMQRLLAEIQELLRKHDYRFADEARGEEMMSWRRAAELFASHPGVY